MNTEKMIRELRRLAEKHKDDNVYTFETNWSLLCSDVADRLETLESRYDNLYACIQKALGEERYNGARIELVNDNNQSAQAIIYLAIEKLREEVDNLQEEVKYLEELRKH